MNNQTNQLTIIGKEIRNYPELLNWFYNSYSSDSMYILDKINEFFNEFPELINFKLDFYSFMNYCIDNSIINLEFEEEKKEDIIQDDDDEGMIYSDDEMDEECENNEIDYYIPDI